MLSEVSLTEVTGIKLHVIRISEKNACRSVIIYKFIHTSDMGLSIDLAPDSAG